jgi:hypothetical protein
MCMKVRMIQIDVYALTGIWSIADRNLVDYELHVARPKQRNSEFSCSNWSVMAERSAFICCLE